MQGTYLELMHMLLLPATILFQLFPYTTKDTIFIKIQPTSKFHFNSYSTIIFKLIARKILKISYTRMFSIFESIPIDLII